MSIREENKKFITTKIKVPESAFSKYHLVSRETIINIAENRNSSNDLALCLFWISLAVAAVFQIDWNNFNDLSIIYLIAAAITFSLGILGFIGFYRKNKKVDKIINSILEEPCEFEKETL